VRLGWVCLGPGHLVGKKRDLMSAKPSAYGIAGSRFTVHGFICPLIVSCLQGTDIVLAHAEHYDACKDRCCENKRLIDEPEYKPSWRQRNHYPARSRRVLLTAGWPSEQLGKLRAIRGIALVEEPVVDIVPYDVEDVHDPDK